MSSRTPMKTPASAIRRFSQVYVEIPPSPLHNRLSRALKENTPFIRKRKLSESHNTNIPVSVPANKKSKLDPANTMAPISNPNNPNNASDEFPNGYFYCHQCCKKRDYAGPFSCFLATCPNSTPLCYSRHPLHTQIRTHRQREVQSQILRTLPPEQTRPAH